MAEHIPITGGCLCAVVRYASRAPPIEGFYCHCTLCRKASGGLFSVTLSFPAATFEFTKGELKYFRPTNFAKRGFCADCGSKMAFFYDRIPDLVWVAIGSLDHPEDWPMTKDASWGRSAHWHTDTKIPWFKISDALPQPTEILRPEAAFQRTSSSR